MQITDIKGNVHNIKDGEGYTVLFRYKRYQQTEDEKHFRHPAPNHNKVHMLTGLYHNYPHDDHIGHDTEDGRGDPLDDRIYFDGAQVPDYLNFIKKKEVLWVGTDAEWQAHLKDFVNAYIDKVGC